MVKNTMPRPPIHCVRLRQKSMPCGRCSTSSRIVAPVVVKPDIVSKYALVKFGMYPPMTKGSVPKRLKMLHVSVTTRKASRRLIMLSELLAPRVRKANPASVVTSMDRMNEMMSSSM